ncbi:hypothetical protein ACC741_37130, partial [Rhizobium johnstonii]
GLVATSPGWAADPTPLTTDAKLVESPSGWTFTVAPYFWMAGISGDIAQFGLPEVATRPAQRTAARRRKAVMKVPSALSVSIVVAEESNISSIYAQLWRNTRLRISMLQ